MKKKFIDDLYERDKKDGSYIIRVQLNNYEDLFNELDPAPFKRRDLNYDLAQYLNDCSMDIPINTPIKLEFLANMDMEEDKQGRSINGFRNYYNYLYSLNERNIKKSYKIASTYVITSIVLLITSIYIGRYADNSSLKVIKEGFNIGGWVFLWEAIAILVFKNREIILNQKRYRRLKVCPINFKYKV